MNTLYDAALLVLRPFAEVWAAVAGRGTRRVEWRQRRGLDLPAVEPGGLWLHGASVGEARLLLALDAARAARPGAPAAVLSALTATGRAALAGREGPTCFAPLDFPAWVARAYDALRPSRVGLVETELWPNLLRAARRRGVPVVLLNARLSPARMRRYLRFRGLYAPLLAGVRAVAAQSPADAERWRRLGAPPERVAVAGNLKYDLPAPRLDRAAARRRLGVPQTAPLLLGGSTREGEEAALARAVLELRRGPAPGARLVLAPRHLRRLDAVEAELRREGVACRRLSAIPPEAGPAPEEEAVLVDALGLLADLYPAADVAFVGGTLAPVGGHNVLEPAAAGVPVVFGPHTGHVEEPAALLEAAGGARRVDGPGALPGALGAWLGEPSAARAAGERARAALDAHRGALARNLDLLLDGSAR